MISDFAKRHGQASARLATAVAAVAVFFVHFRPWQEGLLEEWGLGLQWRSEGFGAYFHHFPATLGRPLNLLPYFAGLSASHGGYIGLYGILALVAGGQFLVAIWALRPLVSSFALRWSLGLLIALHPWWAAGGVLRFMAAQIAVLSIVVWLGACVRLLESGRRRWGALVALAPLVGLLSYQGPALSLLLGAALVPLALRGTSKRKVVIASLTGATVGVVTLWSAVLVPRLSPTSYESTLSGNGLDVPASLAAIATTIFDHSAALVAFSVLVAALVAILLALKVIPRLQGAALLAAVVVAPLASLSYAILPLHLQDPERVALPVGVTLWLILCLVARDLAELPRWRVAVTVSATVASVVGALIGYHVWTGYAASQQALLNGIQGLRLDLPEDAVMVVADNTGRYGDVYTLLPPYLNIALDDQFGPGADAVLCTPEGVERKHPIAAVYPLGTTVDCDTILQLTGLDPVGVLEVPGGHVDIYLSNPGTSS